MAEALASPAPHGTGYHVMLKGDSGVYTESELQLRTKVIRTAEKASGKIRMFCIAFLSSVRIEKGENQLTLAFGKVGIEIRFDDWLSLERVCFVLAGYFAYDELSGCMKALGHYHRGVAPNVTARLKSAAALLKKGENISEEAVSEIAKVEGYATDQLCFTEGAAIFPYLKVVGVIASGMKNLLSVVLAKGLVTADVVSFITGHTKLKEIVFDGGLSDAFHDIARALSGNKCGVEAIGFRNMSVDGKNDDIGLAVGSERVTKITMERVRNANVLNLMKCVVVNRRECVFDDCGAVPFSEAMLYLNGCRSLTLRNCSLEIATVLKQLSANAGDVKHLDLSGNEFSKADFEIPGCLSSLVLRNVRFRDELLATFVTRMCALKCEYDLSDAKCVEWKPVFNAFDEAPRYEVVGLKWDGNEYDDSILRFMKKCHDLTSISMSKCTNMNYVKLFVILPSLTKLEKLVIRADTTNKIGEDASRLLMQLKKCSKLTTLDVTGHMIGINGMYALCSIIASSENVKDVSFEETGVTDQAVWRKFILKINRMRKTMVTIRFPGEDMARLNRNAERMFFERKLKDFAIRDPSVMEAVQKNQATWSPGLVASFHSSNADAADEHNDMMSSGYFGTPRHDADMASSDYFGTPRADTNLMSTDFLRTPDHGSNVWSSGTISGRSGAADASSEMKESMRRDMDYKSPLVHDNEVGYVHDEGSRGGGQHEDWAATWSMGDKKRDLVHVDADKEGPREASKHTDSPYEMSPTRILEREQRMSGVTGYDLKDGELLHAMVPVSSSSDTGPDFEISGEGVTDISGSNRMEQSQEGGLFNQGVPPRGIRVSDALLYEQQRRSSENNKEVPAWRKGTMFPDLRSSENTDYPARDKLSNSGGERKASLSEDSDYVFVQPPPRKEPYALDAVDFNIASDAGEPDVFQFPAPDRANTVPDFARSRPQTARVPPIRALRATKAMAECTEKYALAVLIQTMHE